MFAVSTEVGICCPACKFADSKVLDSRSAKNTIRRRRECLRCQKRFTTYETHDESELREVIRKAEKFDRLMAAIAADGNADALINVFEVLAAIAEIPKERC